MYLFHLLSVLIWASPKALSQTRLAMASFSFNFAFPAAGDGAAVEAASAPAGTVVLEAAAAATSSSEPEAPALPAPPATRVLPLDAMNASVDAQVLSTFKNNTRCPLRALRSPSMCLR